MRKCLHQFAKWKLVGKTSRRRIGCACRIAQHLAWLLAFCRRGHRKMQPQEFPILRICCTVALFVENWNRTEEKRLTAVAVIHQTLILNILHYQIFINFMFAIFHLNLTYSALVFRMCAFFSHLLCCGWPNFFLFVCHLFSYSCDHSMFLLP